MSIIYKLHKLQKINIYNKPVTIFNQILKTNIIQTR